jgi:hypothetical protein
MTSNPHVPCPSCGCPCQTTINSDEKTKLRLFHYCSACGTSFIETKEKKNEDKSRDDSTVIKR